MKIKITCRPRYNPWLKKYLNTKIFSKILAFGILLNNISINSFAGILSEDGRYETFEGSDITIPDILEEDKVDVEIEGNTLVNVLRDVTLINNTNTTTINDDGSISFLHNSFQTTRSSIRFQDAIVEPNKTYTLMFNIVENTLSNSAYNSVAKFNIVNYNYGVHFIRQGDIGIQKVVLKQPDYITSDGKPYLEIHDDTLGGLVIKDIMLLEGDFSDYDISYFEGLKSVGQNNIDDHKIEVISNNKNLLPNSEGWVDGQLVDDGNINTNAVYSLISIYTEEYIKLKKGQYTFSYPDNYEVAYHVWDKNFNYVKDSRWLTDNTFTLDEDSYIKVTIRLKGSYTQDVDFAESMQTHPIDIGTKLTIQLEEGILSTNYTQKLSDKKEILLNEPLRGLPNGVKDRIIKKNGQWVVERNCGKIVFNGTENWQIHGNLSSDNVAFFVLVNNHENNVKLDPYNPIIVNNKFKSVSRTYFDSIKNEEAISLHSNNGLVSWYSVGILKSRLSDNTASSFKQWLNNNPIEVIYQLDIPSYESINTDIVLPLYTNTTHISTNSNIPANLKVTVDRVANRAKEYSELVKENPTIENIALARMWTNKMRESILKDEFQDNIDTITEITDMILDRKTASANLDVYIKSENMLSMNLSTNSITFEDFSGVEDMTKENAVQISINSSLPYNLNAYLATDIQNSDKSNVMNKDILSIKDNSELDYQTFSSINNKVVLKSNCDSGNDKQHDINLKLNGGIAHEKDVYKTTIKFEAEQQ